MDIERIMRKVQRFGHTRWLIGTELEPDQREKDYELAETLLKEIEADIITLLNETDS